ncbi:MAG: DUF1684 domain-containing protein [Gemmatimonadota bacterium]|nr:DUF1684 domain-containing protein [Gemmatimonadota bacterium]
MPVSLFIFARKTPLYAIACCLSLSLGSASADDSIRTQIEALRAAKDSLLKSEDSPLLPAQRARFEQLAYYPIDLRYRLRGELHIYGRQRIVEIPNTDGTTTELERFGRFVAAFGEKDFWLEVYRSPQTGEAEVFFKDLTNGHTTYGGGRYARLTREDDGMYGIDFNNAYNPYCAYNPAYICPLPPRQNHLDFAVEAGELMPAAAPP